MKASWAFLACAFLLGCPPEGAEQTPSAPQPPAAHARFLEIRELLGQEAESRARGVRLPSLVAPICTDAREREALVRSIAWSTSFSTEDASLPTQLALDVLEYVATSCGREHRASALELLRAARPHIENDHGRLRVLQARLLATIGQLEAAEDAAAVAMTEGSNHAIALMANIRARRARNAGLGYRAGMLDAAIETVSVEPTAKWQVIDLTAVLATRARLLNEKAVWQPAADRRSTVTQAQQAFERLARAPFIEAVRRRSQDALCFDAAWMGAPEDACAVAALEHGILGAAQVARLDLSQVPDADEARAQRLMALRARVASLTEDDEVLVVFRGDEAELLEWARPTARLLQGSVAKVTVIDRVQTPRGRALVDRILELAGVQPALRLSLGRDPLAMPCAAALVSGRRAPTDCSLDPESRRSLATMDSPVLSFLVGRDLDSEIDALALYERSVALLSFRRARDPEKVDAWLKSLSDVWSVVDP